VTLEDLRVAARRSDPSRLRTLQALRAEQFTLMEQLARLPADMVFFTQFTMEAAEDPQFLDAMRRAHIRGALVGVEAVTPEGLKDIYKDFNASGEALVERLRTFQAHGIHVLGSFIFGLPSDRPGTFDATLAVAERARLTFAQFVMLTPFPGTVDFAAWEKAMAGDLQRARVHPPQAAVHGDRQAAHVGRGVGAHRGASEAGLLTRRFSRAAGRRAVFAGRARLARATVSKS
jgi:hypothetical protein